MMGPDYKAMLGTHVQKKCSTYNVMQCNEISHKVEKEGKPHGKKPPPKQRDNYTKERYMYG